MTRSRLAANPSTSPSFYRSQALATRAESRIQARERGQREEKYACRYLRLQILLLFLFIIASGVIYLVFIFPFLVQWTGQLNSSKYAAPDRSIRPQTPLINAPSNYTNQAQLEVSGFATPSTQVQFVVNGASDRENLIGVGQNGEFSHIITLREGDNDITAYSYDKNGLESSETKVYHVILDTQVPPIDLETPENHQTFHGRDEQTLTITGHSEPSARIIVNNVATRADVDGYFSLDYRLQDGNNNLDISATDNAENETKISISVDFQP